MAAEVMASEDVDRVCHRAVMVECTPTMTPPAISASPRMRSSGLEVNGASTVLPTERVAGRELADGSGATVLGEAGREETDTAGAEGDGERVGAGVGGFVLAAGAEVRVGVARGDLVGARVGVGRGVGAVLIDVTDGFGDGAGELLDWVGEGTGDAVVGSGDGDSVACARSSARPPAPGAVSSSSPPTSSGAEPASAAAGPTRIDLLTSIHG